MDAFGSVSIGISVMFGDVIMNDGITDFRMSFPLNGYPYGTITNVVPTSFNLKLNSGDFGVLSFINSGHDYFDNSSIPIRINNCSRALINDTSMSVTVDFIVGVRNTLSKHTFAVADSTSLDAFREVFKTIGIDGIEDHLLTMENSPVDSMTWRFVNANSAEMANDIVDHSCIPGEFVVWGFNERTGKVFLNGYSAAKRECADYLMFSPNARQSTGSNTITDPSSGKTFWMYGTERKCSTRGDTYTLAFPEVVVSSVNGGSAEISKCGTDCLLNLATQMGAKSAEETLSDYGIPTDGTADKNDIYGDITVVSDFPLNTHKYYPVATSLRGKIMSEYSKMMVIDIYNDLGPVVGSAVAVRTIMPDLAINGPTDDSFFTDRYIVVSKDTSMSMARSGGILGSANSNESPIMTTTLTLVSNGNGDQSVSSEMQSLLSSLKSTKLISDSIVRG